jgi:hypothetical protein
VEEFIEGRKDLPNHGYVELRAVICIDGKEAELHMSNIYDPTWRISQCDQATKESVLPIARRIYDAVFDLQTYR